MSRSGISLPLSVVKLRVMVEVSNQSLGRKGPAQIIATAAKLQV